MMSIKRSRGSIKETCHGLALLLLVVCLPSLGGVDSTDRVLARAAILQVNSTLDEVDAAPGDGSCASTPSGVCTLRAAVQEGNALPGADTISLPASIFTLTIAGRGEDLAASGDLDILESVTIQGAGYSSTVVDANAIDRALQVFSPAVVTLKDLSIQGGDSGTESGGGIATTSGSQLTLQDTVLGGNTTGGSGGGLYNNGGQVELHRVRVVDNQAANAAGIHSAGTLAAYDTTIAGNLATQYGGGLLNTGALTLERVTVSGNMANTNGGGLYLHSSDPLTGHVSIVNSTISGNQAKAFMGGGVWVYYQTELWVTNSTIAGNSAGQGGGIFNYHQQGALTEGKVDAAQEGNLHLLNTLVANNTFANCGRSAQTQPIHSLGGNLDSAVSCELNLALGDLVSTDPQLGALQNNGGMTMTMPLLGGSPAIDSGNDTGCPATDQRGVSRPQGDQCDRGAYEYQAGGQGAHRQYIPLMVR